MGVFRTLLKFNRSCRMGGTGWLISIFAVTLLGSSMVVSQQAMAGGPIIVGRTIVLDAKDRVSGQEYSSNAITNAIQSIVPIPSTVRVYPGDTVQFAAVVQNWDPVFIPAPSLVRVYGKDFNKDIQWLNPVQFLGDDNYVFEDFRFYAFLNTYLFKLPPVTMTGPGSDTPGKQYCQLVTVAPQFYIGWIPLIPYWEYKRNFPSDFIGPVPVGPVMSCAEIAYVYNLKPSITLNDEGVGGGTVDISTAVSQDTLPDGAPRATYSQETQWQVSQFFLPADTPEPGDTISSSLAPCRYFQTNYQATSCTIPKLSDGRTDAKSNGTNTIFDFDGSFKSGTALPSALGPPGNIPNGYKLCYALSVSKYRPYMSIFDLGWRNSKVVCVSDVIREPKIQILGGDVRVGRYFHNDNEDGSAVSAGIYTKATKGSVAGTDTMFGSWVEYGALAPGPVANFASLSGYSGGFPMTSPTQLSSGCPKEVNRLTFANTGTAHCGSLKQGIGHIPDVVTALRSWTPVADPAVNGTLQLNAASHAGMYKNENSTAGLTISGSELTAGVNHTYVVYVPKETVKITGNITIKDYNSQTYSSIKDIPQLIIVAKNIYIDSSVTRIDAWLVAHGSGDDGVIDTCHGFTGAFSASVCSNQLTLNGPVMARQLLPWRTVANATDQPAETVNLPASSLLWAINQTNPNRIQTTYTTELPPFF